MRSCAVSEPVTPPPLPTADNITVGKHPCTTCGGDMQWSAGKQALVCPYCGTESAWKAPAPGMPGDIVEHDLDEALARVDGAERGWGEARREVRCQSCHAVSVFEGNRVAQRCDFCGSPAVIAQEASQDAITPESLLPFQMAESKVRDSVRQWYGTRWFAPNALKRAALTDTLHGVYLPYWTFDAHVDAPWQAEAGHYYYVPVTVRGPNGTTSTRMERRVRWVPAAGRVQHFFDDVLIPASSGVHAALLRQVEPFPTRDRLRPYSPEFVRGWTVERYQVDLRQAAGTAQSSMEQQTRELCAAQVPGDTYRNLRVQREYAGRTFKHVLVPVWVVGYTYGSKNYQIIANGYTGQIAGERPYSWVKIFFAVVCALVVATIVLGVMQNT